MDIGIGIPNSVRGTTGAQLLDWAERADRAGFSSLATIGAVSYPSHEELTVLGAAAAVTERIRLLPNVLIAPARSAAELAKQAATVDQLSDGRLTLGLGIGWREPDYVLTGRDFADRAGRFEQLLIDLESSWKGKTLADGTRPAAPEPVQDRIPVLVGGTTSATVRRVVAYGDGWTAGGLPPEVVADLAGSVRDAWRDAGRGGSPHIAALSYFSLGGNDDASREYLLDYYQPMGDEIAQMIAGTALRSEDAIAGAIDAFRDAGVDELILDPTVSDPAQVDLLAEVVF